MSCPECGAVEFVLKHKFIQADFVPMWVCSSCKYFVPY